MPNPNLKYERIASALAATATPRGEGVVLVDERGRIWFPNTSGGHSLPGTPVRRVRPTKGVFGATTMNRAFGVLGASNHQRKIRRRFGGQYVRVRLIWESPQILATPGWSVTEHAVTSGRSPNDVNPLTAAGAAATWQVSSGAVAVPANSATAGSVVETYSPWYTVYVEPDTVSPKWGTIFIRSRNGDATNPRGRTANASNGFPNLMNSASVLDRDIYEYFSSATAINSASAVLTSSADDADANRNVQGFQVEFEILGDAITYAAAGDSRTQGNAATGNLWSEHVRAVEDLALEGQLIGYEYVGLQGLGHAAFHAMAMERLARTSRKLPDIFALQAASSNSSTWTDADVAAAMARNMDFAQTCRASGVQPVFITMYPSVSATDATGAANWRKLNDAVLASGVPCMDYYSHPALTDGKAIPALPTNAGLTPDGAHLNDIGRGIAKTDIVIPVLRELIGANGWYR